MRLSFLYTALFLLLAIVAKAQVFEHDKIVESEKKAASAYIKPTQIENNSATDLIYHNIYWEVDPAIYYIKGKVSHVFRITNDGTNQIFVDLSNPLMVDSILHSTGKLEFTHTDAVVTINLANTLNKNDFDTVTIYYQGEPAVQDGFGSFSTSLHNDTPILWTLSEPYGAKDWWPCKQSLYDKVDSIDITIKVPVGNKVGTNGVLKSEKTEGDRVIYHWKHKHPIATYLIAIAVTNYSEFTDFADIGNGDTVKILNYVYPENLESLREDAKFTIDVMQLYSDLFIPYPFKDEKYGHAQFGWSGGMEHQTMSFMYYLSKELTAHELAHQWFGNHVTCGSWQDIWVNEGFATYLTGLMYEHLIPNYWMAWKESTLNRVITNGEEGSVFVDDTTDVGRIFSSTLSYTKGAWVLHMLRYQIGDEVFYNGCNLLLTQEKTAQKFATTSDVQDAFETAADTTLSDFFESWIYNEGYPKFKIEWLQNMDGKVDLRLVQTPTHESETCFKMKIPILFIGENNEVLANFHQTNADESFSFNPGFTVTKVVFDPEYNILAPHPAWVVVNISENAAETDFKLFPNPAKNELTIKADKNNIVQQFEIISTSGKTLYASANRLQRKKLHVDLSELNDGIYYVRALINGHEVVKQFVKN